MGTQEETRDTLGDLPSLTRVADLKEGTPIHRYQILGLIGKGGMGAVYKAYDPELDRSIAIKILTAKPKEGETASRPQARLMREAQALAKLNHPNVVAVHDVGTYEEGIYIAMEYVKGETLREWLKEHRNPNGTATTQGSANATLAATKRAKPTQKEIIEVLSQAGKGLEAAHKKGIVHRDFKPDNVLIGENGQVKVVDFGLARAAGGVEATGFQDESALDQEPITGEKLLSTPLTQIGAMLGTTVYMAPEHFQFQLLDEKTDQFSFCVTLFEALYGKRPFAGKTTKDLKENVTTGTIEIPPEANVPTWIEDIIRRGIAVSKKDRYPSMAALLQTLGHDPVEHEKKRRAERNRKTLVFALIILTLGLPIGVWYGFRYRTVQLCKAAEVEFIGVWDKTTKGSVKSAFLDTNKSYAQATWERVEETVDSYQQDWMRMRSDICEAKWIRGTQSEEGFDLRMRCLRKRLIELGALVNVFVQADAGVVEKSVQASSSLSAIGVCADEEALRSPYPPPETAQAKTKVTAMRNKLAEVEALEKTGKYREGLELVRKIEVEANAIDYRPLQAEMLYRLGKLLYEAGKYKEAETTLHDAARAAAETRDALLSAKALTCLVWVEGYIQGRHEAGLSTARDAEIVLGLGGDDDVIRALLFNNWGALYWRKGNYDKALAYHRKSLTIRKRLYGHEHPQVSHSLNNVGTAYWNQGEYKKALEYYRDSLTIRKKALGPEHPHVATSLYNIGLLFNNQGEYDKALDYYGRALSIWEKALGADHSLVAMSLSGIGVLYWLQGKYDSALEYNRRALEIREKTLGPEHSHVAMSLNHIGDVFWKKGENRKALVYYGKALGIWEKALGPGHPNVVYPLSGIGSINIRLGRSEKALGPLERALQICEKKTCEQDPHGNVLFGLARALVATKGNVVRATKLAKQAQAIYGKTPKAFKKERKEVDVWLVEHGKGQ